MSVLSYLDTLSSNLVLSSTEKGDIDTSISTLVTRINSHFSDVSEHFKFGSFTRGTILPRKADEHSDIDYMLIFKNPNGYKPQSFLNRLKSFVEQSYSRSEIYQSHPTIVLELKHDLLPIC